MFPDFFQQYSSHFRYLWIYPDISLDDMPNRPGTGERFQLAGPITYTGQAEVRRDIETLQTALQGLGVADAFITATPPTGRRADRNIQEFYPNAQAYAYAVADALHEEYKAITDARRHPPVRPGIHQHLQSAGHRRARRGGQLRAAGHPRRAGALPPLLGEHESPPHHRRAAAKIRAAHAQDQGPGVLVEAANPATNTSGCCGRTSSCRTARS